MAINVVALTGRLVRDPEVKKTQSGVSVCSFSVAVERSYKSGEERQTDFIDCVAWRSSADFLQKYFHKGDTIGISGRLQTRSWETQEGQKRKATEVVADSLSFVSSKRSESGGSGSSPAPSAGSFDPVDVDVDDDDLPF